MIGWALSSIAAAIVGNDTRQDTWTANRYSQLSMKQKVLVNWYRLDYRALEKTVNSLVETVKRDARQVMWRSLPQILGPNIASHPPTT